VAIKVGRLGEQSWTFADVAPAELDVSGPCIYLGVMSEKVQFTLWNRLSCVRERI
jgi:hypothetical protein